MMCMLSCYQYLCTNIWLERDLCSRTELCNKHLPSTIKAINFKTTWASNRDSQLSNPTAKHRRLSSRYLGCSNQRWPAGNHSHPSCHHYFMVTITYFTNPETFSVKRIPYNKPPVGWTSPDVAIIFPKLTFRCVQMRLCHSCEYRIVNLRRRSSCLPKTLALFAYISRM